MATRFSPSRPPWLIWRSSAFDTSSTVTSLAWTSKSPNCNRVAMTPLLKPLSLSCRGLRSNPLRADYQAEDNSPGGNRPVQDEGLGRISKSAQPARRSRTADDERESNRPPPPHSKQRQLRMARNQPFPAAVTSI